MEKGSNVVVVEDLISTGGSSLKAVEALKSADVNVKGMVAIFTYGFDLSETNFKNARVELATLSNYDHLIEEAIDKGYVGSNELETLKNWRIEPSKWNQ